MNQNFSLYEFLQTPVWIFDIHQKRILWANSASLSLWEAKTTDELTARDLSLDMSEAVDAILDGYLSRFQQGEKIKTWWYFSPNNVIKKALCYFSGMPGPNGNTVMLVEVIAEEASLRRELAFSGSSNLALLFDENGSLISANNSFTHSFGEDLKDLAAFSVTPS